MRILIQYHPTDVHNKIVLAYEDFNNIGDSPYGAGNTVPVAYTELMKQHKCHFCHRRADFPCRIFSPHEHMQDYVCGYHLSPGADLCLAKYNTVGGRTRVCHLSEGHPGPHVSRIGKTFAVYTWRNIPEKVLRLLRHNRGYKHVNYKVDSLFLDLSNAAIVQELTAAGLLNSNDPGDVQMIIDLLS